MTKKNKLCGNHLKLLPFYIFYVLIIVVVINNPFFWDKDILISRRAFWLLENGFNLKFPNSIDTGNIPALSVFIALLWKIFGMHIAITHLLMIPFAFGLIYQFFNFLKFFANDQKFITYTLVLLLIDTVLLSQIVVVSSDLILVFFFFLSVNSILYRKRYLLYFSILGLSLTHHRGIMSCVIIFLFDYLMQFKLHKNKKYFTYLLKIIPQYLPATVILITYYAFHYYYTGWIFKHENSPWSGCFIPVNFKGFMFNIGILAWRIIDFGRLFIWIILGILVLRILKGKIKPDSKTRILIILIILSVIIYFPLMLIYKVLSAHRYILPFFILVTILTTYLSFVISGDSKLKKTRFIILFIGLISGHFWIYPDKIAKGWDSTIAHIPYYSLRKKMIRYLEEKGIPFESVGTDSPMTAKFKYVDLNDDNRIFKEKNFITDDYILYSNIINEFLDEEIDELKTHWILEKEYRCVQVKMQLYKRPESKNVPFSAAK